MSDKWISLESLETPTAEFAAEVLRVRMGYVAQMLPLAAHEFRRDSEHVHQLRVGCRRAGAALHAFKPLLRGKPLSLQKWLRRMRRAAGPARDIDVLLLRLKDEAKKSPEDAQLSYLVARLKRYRTHAQQALVEIAEKAQKGKLDRSLTKCLAVLQQEKVKTNHQTVGQFAHWALQGAGRSMIQLSDLRQPTISQLHDLRIASKRLRYSIELFSGAFPLALRNEAYPLVENIQSRLGSLNDHATAQALFQRWLVNLPADRRAAYLARRIAEEHESSLAIRDEFLTWWTPKRVAKLESHLAELIDA